MHSTDSGTPVASSDWNEVDLGVNEGTSDGDLDFLGDLDTDTNMALSVTNSDHSLESGSLTGLGLLLNGKDAHDLVGELVASVGDQSVNDWSFLDWDGVCVDLLERVDLASLDKSAELGERSPLFSLEAASSSSATWASTASSAALTASATSGSEASATSAASFSLFSALHFYVVFFLGNINNLMY